MITVYVFPGQGSQKKGMGETLFDDYKELTAKADDVLGYSIKRLCLEDPYNQLEQTQYTQPALYVTNALTYLKKIKETGKRPAYVAGHSLGEYNALFAAEAFNFENGLKLVEQRGELMSQAKGGGMAAVVGLTEEKITELLKKNGFKNLSIANYNSPSRIVVSGSKKEIDQAQRVFEVAGAMYIPLKVSGAFHTHFMDMAKDAFKEYIKDFEFSELRIPVISNVDARPYEASQIKENLIKQLTHSVQWTESICYLMGLGEVTFEEIGPGKVLTGLINKIQKEVAPGDIAKIKTTTGNEEKDRKIENLSAIECIPIMGAKGKAGVDKKQKGKQPQGEKVAIVPKITVASLGSEAFKKDYNIKYAYVAGGMYRGIASKELVVRMGKAGLMGYYGTGGMPLEKIEEAIRSIQEELQNGGAYGMNMLSDVMNPQKEDEIINLFLKYGINNIEAAAYMQLTPAIVRYRLKGLRRGQNKNVIVSHKIMAKVSRPEVAELFLSPAPERIVKQLLEAGKLTSEEAALSKEVPMADHLCVEADSAGHTDRGIAYALMPAMLKLRDEMMTRYKYAKDITIGAAGGIGTPEAASAAFMLGADFILTGSINQCTAEAGTSEAVKDLLQEANVQDMEYAPAGDMFELGAKIQVLRKGLFFPARANKLYDLYQHHNSLDEIDEKTRNQIQERYFKRSFEKVYEETKEYLRNVNPEEVPKAEQSPKHKMALVFRWYFDRTTNLALRGSEEQKVDYQIQCGPALGAFNQWVKGTELEDWRNRHVDEIAEKLMQETAKLLNQRFKTFFEKKRQ